MFGDEVDDLCPRLNKGGWHLGNAMTSLGGDRNQSIFAELRESDKSGNSEGVCTKRKYAI
jgi:hypothetical protein